MSKKHFIAIAAALFASEASYRTVCAVADTCEDFNGNFDRERFITAAYSPEAQTA